LGRDAKHVRLEPWQWGLAGQPLEDVAALDLVIEEAEKLRAAPTEALWSKAL